jgi:hypothetical protein
MILQALEYATSPPLVLNVTGPERLSVREVAEKLGCHLGKAPRFRGQESKTACLGNSQEAFRRLGTPCISADELIQAVADWVRSGGKTLGKPTHFEVRDGVY